MKSFSSMNMKEEYSPFLSVQLPVSDKYKTFVWDLDVPKVVVRFHKLSFIHALQNNSSNNLYEEVTIIITVLVTP